MKHHSKTPKLADLAVGCNQGACNPTALINALPAAIAELDPFEVKHHPAVKFIIGHISYLLGQSSGPTVESCDEYVSWRDASPPAA